MESCIGALKRKAGAMLYHAHMSAAFWCEAVAHSLLIRNSLGISAYENGITPTELYHHRKAPEGSLPTFHGGALAPPRELGWGSSPQEAAVRFVRDGLHIQVQLRRKSTPGTTRAK